MKIEFNEDELGSGKDGLEIAVKGFKGYENSQVYIEVYEGKLAVRVWDGMQEDPVTTVKIEPGIGEF